MKINTLCIIGVGLIGGSLARALRKAGACGHIVGCSRQRQNLEKALALGVIDRFETDVAKAVAGADMVVVAVPLLAMEPLFHAMAGKIAPDAVITDGGSAKQSVVAAARAAFGRIPGNLVPAHPIAGTERSGVEASFDTLFQDRRVIITPVAETDPVAIDRVHAMWEATGAMVARMAPRHHDEVLAATSHLPHVLAYALVDMLGEMDKRTEIFRYAAGGFRDFTRIASSDPRMWRDICLANTDAIVAVLERFQEQLQSVTEVIRDKEGDSIESLFERAKRYRDRNT
uniref:prephenate dehydrogenase n=1 Tax=Candidatus Kentrum sp. FM TaxID=2126340 RepID=A0A450WIW2_9GAMM|nr:MAG: prephenate dehydrogenase [Candidatus Kentron sp. FM]VFJ61450.1 MAG: prephenate dehydrogenase [Candidatus Kentron sp. FM]VFK16973.1 MAG: prephenate dehydrogenase [Candidatus Kentron sp. FM]